MNPVSVQGLGGRLAVGRSWHGRVAVHRDGRGQGGNGCGGDGGRSAGTCEHTGESAQISSGQEVREELGQMTAGVKSRRQMELRLDSRRCAGLQVAVQDRTRERVMMQVRFAGGVLKRAIII